MGVKGLTTFLKENRHKLSYTIELTSKDSGDNDTPSLEKTQDIRVVVDGWSLIYTVYNISGEPWVYGGEYAALAGHVERIVLAWRRAGIRPTFVFDGPTPPLKYPTLISRLQNNIVKQANLFFRTSAVARSTTRSLAETRIAPPLGYTAIVSTLLSMGDDIKVEFAEGEADSHIVSLAGQLGAYVIGNDSDFIVLNCEGYKGYIPLDEMVWYTSNKDTDTPTSQSPSLVDGDDSEFQTVTRKKQKVKSKVKASHIELGTGPIPQVQSDSSLLLTVYEPTTFAKHLSLPPSLLPLLGALIGNDYASFDFFRSSESMVNRVQRVADTLSSVLREAQSGNAKKIRKIDRGGQGSVMDVIGTTVERLLLWRDPRYPPTSGQIDNITETVVQSTLEYAMDGATSLFLEVCSNQQPSLDDSAAKVRDLYLRAYHRGIMHPRLIEVFARGSCFPALFLEDPDRECCARIIGRPIREIIWKFFASGGGIPERPEPLADNDEQLYGDVAEDEDELVDVVEELSEDDDDLVGVEEDPLAALRGKLQRLSFSGSDALEASNLSQPVTEPHTPTSYVEIPKRSPYPRVVAEYVRRGARVASEDAQVTGLDDFSRDESENTIPVQLRPVEDRLGIFLRALGSDTLGIRAIADEESEAGPLALPGRLLSIIALRCVLRTLHARTVGLDDGSRKREREKEKWTRLEARAFLTCLLDQDDEIVITPLEDRAIQLSAQVLSALEAVGWLAQALLLVDLPQSCQRGEDHLPVVFGDAEKRFSGRKFHAALAQPKESVSKLLHKFWDATIEGLEETFGDERGKRGKKERKERRNASDVGRQPETTGLFGVLAALDTQ